MSREIGMLFSDSMVRAILRGAKVQTRRPCRMLAGQIRLRDNYCAGPVAGPVPAEWIHSPYRVGDRIWVRECWRLTGGGDSWQVIYRADESESRQLQDRYRRLGLDGLGRKDVPRAHWEAALEQRACTSWRPSIHMPRWAARLELRITGVRVERLQDISTADVEAEGIDVAAKLPAVVGPGNNHEILAWQIAQREFAKQWNATYVHNRKPGLMWSDNPWVWVISFERTGNQLGD